VREDTFDVVHSHLHVHALVFSAFIEVPIVSTLHGSAWNAAHHPVLNRFADRPFISISESERRFLPQLNYVATVHNGVDTDAIRPGPGGDRLLFAGRIAPEKAPDLAIDTALRSGRDIVVAGPTDEAHRDFFESRVKPSLLHSAVEYVGDLEAVALYELMGSSYATIFPLRWEEPFGLVIPESLAAGTPVVAWSRGATKELISTETGAVVDSVDAAVTALGDGGWDRAACRARAEERFSLDVMAHGYVDAFAQLLSA
jgi:glycosyltransferase involved in cell wall biosynthesis